MTRVAECIIVLQKEVNAKYPNRPKESDGTYGDARHQAEVSDHNPNGAGVVTAWDITAAPFCDDLAKRLASVNEPRVKYVIWKHRIWSRARATEGWRLYDGADPHTSHIHLSVSADHTQYDRTDPWNVFSSPVEKVSRLATLDNEDLAAIDAIVKKYARAILGNTQADDDKTHVSLADLSRKMNDVISKS